MPKIYVLYSIDLENKEPFELYTVSCGIHKYMYGYWKIYDPRPPEQTRLIREECDKKIKALQTDIFEKDAGREFQLRQKGKKIPGVVIHDNTPSVFLGLYLTLYQKIRNVRFNADWTSITVTGDIKIEGKNIELSGVGYIKDKFEDFKKGIEREYVNDGGKHLFVYVSDNPLNEVKSEGNITVRHFSPLNTHDTIESVRNCVFEKQYEDELQEFLCTNIRDQTRNIDYIPTQACLNIEADIGEKILGSKMKGCFIWGEGEGGKSETAEALARHLMMVDTKIYAPIWVKIGDDLKGNRRDDITLRGAAKEYIIEKIGKKVEGKEIEISDLKELTEFLEKHQYVLVIDNLEFDNEELNEVLQGIKDIIEDMQLNRPYLIITSRTSCTASIANEMGLEPIKSPELYKEDIEKFFDTIIGSDISLPEIKQKNEYPEFIEALYEHFRSYPGLIIPAIKSVESGKTIESLLPELKNIHAEGIDEKALIIFRAVFSMLDESSQAVLFTLLDKISPDTTIGQDKLIDAVKEKAEAAMPSLLIPGMAEKALDNLVNKALIYSEAGEEDKLPQYGIKEVPFLAFMFGDIFAGQSDAEEKENLRKILVKNAWRLRMALRYERPVEIIDKLENDIGDPFELAYRYCQEAIFRNPKKYITKSIEYYDKFNMEVENNIIWGDGKYHGPAVSSKNILQYLQALFRASKINESWDELKRFLSFLSNSGFGYWNLAPALTDTVYTPRLLKEIGDACYALRFYNGLTEGFFYEVNFVYDRALNECYDELNQRCFPTYIKATIRGIRATKIKKAINLGEWSDVTRYDRASLLKRAKEILTRTDDFDIEGIELSGIVDFDHIADFDINQDIDPWENADKEMALANIYLKLSNLFKNKTLKEKSITSYINARDVYAKGKDRVKYGFAWAELSVAYMACNPTIEDINQSINACNEALKVFQKNDFPVYYAETMNHLGNAYKALVKERDDKFFEENIRIFREAEEIFQGREMYHFMAGRIKHDIGDLYLNYALNPSHNNNRKAELLRESINIFKKANELNGLNEFLEKYKYPGSQEPIFPISTLLFQGQACLGLAEILPDDNEEKVRRLEEAIETLGTGITICIKYSIGFPYEYKWLYYNNALVHERLYKFTRNPEDIDKALSNVAKAMEYANFKEKEKMEADYSRMVNIKTDMGPCP
jgi:tetratricopeptide (TPR) repeat protein